MMSALLALEDGTIYRGVAFGAKGVTRTGEVCFNTSMTGYQEALTDPSYRGQILSMTYPHIGNYGINESDNESYEPHVRGFVVRELSPVVSNWRSSMTLGQFLDKYGVPGIQGIDTRALTRQLRVEGSMRGVISTDDTLSEADAIAMAKDSSGVVGMDFVKEVTAKEAYDWDSAGQSSEEFHLPNSIVEENGGPAPLPPADISIAAIDLGAKYNILRCLRRAGFKTRVFPATASSASILESKPAGIFLSNGPGDPAALAYAVSTARELIDSGIPIFGICLGHQILSQAFGAKTFKLKFGHRGANQPVKDVATNRIEITSQNHGFAVDPDSLDADVEVSKINLNDQTVEGLRHKSRPIFSVQYHPEASPGPHDSSSLFQEFRRLIQSQ